MSAPEKQITIMILDDEEDILDLYTDFLTRKGHCVLKTYVNAETILDDMDIERPDVYIIDYRLPGNKNGIEVASEILKKFPTSCIIFVTAFELLQHEISKHHIFYDKSIDILIKPIKLTDLEVSMLNLVHNMTETVNEVAPLNN